MSDTKIDATLWLRDDVNIWCHPDSLIISVGRLTIYPSSADALRRLATACHTMADRMERGTKVEALAGIDAHKEAHGEVCETDPCEDCQAKETRHSRDIVTRSRSDRS